MDSGPAPQGSRILRVCSAELRKISLICGHSKQQNLQIYNINKLMNIYFIAFCVHAYNIVVETNKQK